mgnify:CR=1 FL=1
MPVEPSSELIAAMPGQTSDQAGTSLPGRAQLDGKNRKIGRLWALLMALALSAGLWVLIILVVRWLLG